MLIMPALADEPGQLTGTVNDRALDVAGVCDEVPADQVFSFSTDGGEADTDGDGIAIEVGRWGAHWSLFVELDGKTVFHGMLPFDKTDTGARYQGTRTSVDGSEVALDLVITCGGGG
jgi:hypothetical protein